MSEKTTAAKVDEKAPVDAKYVIEVENDDPKKPPLKCYLKNISRATLEQVLAMTTGVGRSPEMIRAGEVIINSCWVGGDDEIKTNESYLIAAAMQAYQVVEIKTASIKKL